MKVYIERPVSENPGKEGWYYTIGSEGFSFWNGEKWDNKITHWLQAIEEPTGSIGILVEALNWYADPGNYMFDDIQLATAYVNDNLSNKAKIALRKFTEGKQPDKEDKV